MTSPTINIGELLIQMLADASAPVAATHLCERLMRHPPFVSLLHDELTRAINTGAIAITPIGGGNVAYRATGAALPPPPNTTSRADDILSSVYNYLRTQGPASQHQIATTLHIRRHSIGIAMQRLRDARLGNWIGQSKGRNAQFALQQHETSMEARKA